MSNCFIWAVRQYWKKGGYIIMRQANPPSAAWVPHFLWSPDLHEFWEFVPEGKRWLLFKGFVRQTQPVADKWLEGFMHGIETAGGKTNGR